MSTLSFIIGVVAIVMALGVVGWIQDGIKRAEGRKRRNDLLTEFGYGSFGDGVKASAESAAWGCFGKIFALVALGVVGLCFRGCEDEKNKSNGNRQTETVASKRQTHDLRVAPARTEKAMNKKCDISLESARERARQEAVERARQEAAERARQEDVERARREVAERARQEAAEKARAQNTQSKTSGETSKSVNGVVQDVIAAPFDGAAAIIRGAGGLVNALLGGDDD